MASYFLDFTLGNDANPGTSSGSPWKNISKIATGLIAGDIVNFKRGELWQRSATLTLVGGVTYQAYGSGAAPIIEGADLWAGTWTVFSGSVYSQTGVTTVDSASGLLWEDGVKGVRQTSAAAVTQAGFYFLDDPADTLYYWSRTGAGGNPTGRRVNVANNNSPFQMSGSNGAISNIVFRYAAGTALSGGAAAMGNGWVLTNCRYSGCRVHGLSQFVAAAGISITCRNCEFDNNGQDGVLWVVGTNNSLWEDCLFHDNTVLGIAVDGNTNPSNNIIRRCQAYNNGQDGIVINANGNNDIVEYCIAHDNGLTTNDRTGMKSFGQGTTFRYCDSYSNNTAFALGTGFQFDTGSTNGLVHHCQAWFNANAGGSITGNGHQFYNNTFSRNKKVGIEFFGATLNNLKIKNNIFANNGDAANTDDFQGRCCLSDDNNLLGAATGTDVDYNDYQAFSGGQTVFIHWNAVNYATFAAFRAAITTQEVHGISVDPLMVDPANADFHLQSGSTVKDIGLVITNISDVFNGAGPDMGRWESAGAVAGGLVGTPRQRTWGD